MKNSRIKALLWEENSDQLSIDLINHVVVIPENEGPKCKDKKL